MNIKKEEIKQIKFLIIILVIVIVVAVILNLNKENNTTANTTKNEITEIDDSEYEINGITEEELEGAKEFIDTNTYNEYKKQFEEYKNGEAVYTPENNIIKEEDKMTDEEVENLFTEQDEKGKFYYYETEDGEKTDIKIYEEDINLEQY